MNVKDTQLSKLLSWVLRHGAVKVGFEVSAEGYIEVNKLLQHKLFRNQYNKRDIERVVCNNDKQRFKLRLNPHSHILEIKANQGHTIIEVNDSELSTLLEPKYNTVIHGTYQKCWPQIKVHGISLMKRLHIHLAKGTLEDHLVISGLRINAEIHIYIDLAKALGDGLKFYESENGVILTRGDDKGYLKPKYFSKVVKVDTVSRIEESPRKHKSWITNPSSQGNSYTHDMEAKVAQPLDVASSSVAQIIPSTSNAIEAVPVGSPKDEQADSIKAPNATAGASNVAPSGGTPKRTPRKVRPSNVPVETDHINKSWIHVTGYPSYTQKQDLIRVFSTFGNVKVEKITTKFAYISFSNEEEATAALQATDKLIIYGEFLTVKPYNAKLAAEEAAKPQTPKRDFPRSKEKVTILPKQIDLNGDFYHQLDSILCAVRLTQEDVSALSALYTDLETVLQALWPGCTAVPFGSITTGLGTKTSDADCFINMPVLFRHPHGNFVNKAKRLLQQYPQTFTELISIPRANTPIVKFFYVPTETNCDVTFKTVLGVQNSKLFAFLLHADPRIIPMAVVIKYWAKLHDLTGTGKLTNYALTILMIFYLQQPPISIIPSVEWLQRDPSYDVIVDFWNTGFMNRREFLPPSSNTSSISELLGGFFEYYAKFDFDTMVVCPYLGVPIKKYLLKDFNELPHQFERYKNNIRHNIAYPMRCNTPFCVQDPFEQCHNVASAVTWRLALDITTYFKFAANAYEKEKLNDCKEFFKIILLQKPELARGKISPEFRVNLFPRIIISIRRPDWKSVVKEIMFTIFENLLKIKLGKMEEKVNPDSRKEKEKYSGSLTKPIWKRKKVSKLYYTTNNSFMEKQKKITEEILADDQKQINLKFHLLLTYCHDPKSSVVAIRYSDGDLDAFREFGKFFISITQNWFVELMKPYAKPAQKDMATKIAETINDLDKMTTNDEEDSDNDSTPLEPCTPKPINS